MKKLFIILIALSSLAFAKQSKSHENVYVDYSEPIYEIRHIRDYERNYEYRHRSDYESSNHIGLDTVIGATIGVAIGNKLAKGHKGKDIAQVAGGLIGVSIANNSRHGYYEPVHHKPHHRHYKKRKVLVGYKNYFVYDDMQYFKITKRPKNKIRITKTISF